MLAFSASIFLFVLFAVCNHCCADDPICPSYPPISNLSPSTFASILDEVDEYIENTIIKPQNITGFITTIVYDQQLLFAKGYGLRNYLNSSSPPPTADDLVMIASNTKLFTAMLTYYLRDNRQYNLSLHDPITKYLSSFSIESIYSSNRPLTLYQLLSHTSGLQDSTPYPYGDVSSNETAILQALSTRYLIYPPYTQYHYSNLGFAVLGRAIEKVFCDGCYEQYMKQIVLNGLNFSLYSGFNFSQHIIDNYCAYGWTLDDANNQQQLAPIADSYWDNPNGGMLASANDMAKFMMFMFRDNMTTQQHAQQILDGTTVTEMLKAKILLNDGKEAIGTPFEMHYHPFTRLRDGKVSGVWYKGKQGEVPGYRSSTMLIPDYKLGVFTVALEDPPWISEQSVWSNQILNMMLPQLDDWLYQAYQANVEFYLPENWKLLQGQYVCQQAASTVNISVNEGQRSYLYLDDGVNRYNFQLFAEGVVDVFRLGLDLANSTETCFWGEVPQVNELIYFSFVNGEHEHADSFLYDESPCKHVL